MIRALIPLFALLSTSIASAAPPSLAKRSVEDRGMAEPVRTVMPPAAADATLKTQIAGLVERAQGGESAFATLLPQAKSAAASAGGEGSEGWGAAQLMLSALEDARAPATQALSELDSTIAARLNSGSDAGLIELQAADIQVAALTEAQQRELDSLRARLTR